MYTKRVIRHIPEWNFFAFFTIAGFSDALISKIINF